MRPASTESTLLFFVLYRTSLLKYIHSSIFFCSFRRLETVISKEYLLKHFLLHVLTINTKKIRVFYCCSKTARVFFMKQSNK